KRIALWAPNSPEWVATYFGAVCAGATIVPLDQQANAASAAEWLAHSEAALLVTTQARRTTLADASAALPATVVLDGEPSDPDSWQALLTEGTGAARDAADDTDDADKAA